MAADQFPEKAQVGCESVGQPCPVAKRVEIPTVTVPPVSDIEIRFHVAEALGQEALQQNVRLTGA